MSVLWDNATAAETLPVVHDPAAQAVLAVLARQNHRAPRRVSLYPFLALFLHFGV